MELKLLISLNSVLHKQRNLGGGGGDPQNLCSHTCLHNEMKDVSEIVGHCISVCCQMRRMINLFFFKLSYSNDRLPHYHQLQTCSNYLNHSQKTPFHLPTPCSLLRNKPACRNLPKDNACASRTNYPAIFPTLTA